MISTHIPEIVDNGHKKQEYEKLRDGISRFLESFQNNIGLNFLSGFIRLSLDEYEDADGKIRFESSLRRIKETFNKEDQEIFLTYLIENLGNHLSKNQKEELSLSISKYYQNKLEYLSEYYDLPHIMNDFYSQKIKELGILNKKFYEQLAKI